jgi:putative component of toxin-antitoxin plasmid stabilization module
MYFVRRGDILILMLGGSTKATQDAGTRHHQGHRLGSNDRGALK